ncbi:DMT family transporter [Amaricoccus macauensis]|uniref:DMT family transporter n=1 Tax=Amaricoccus macauensis TaxID=57001 RepID=UPI003C7D0A14
MQAESAIRLGSGANLAGAMWMVLAMAAFAVEDAFIKGASRALPVGQILMLFGLGGAAVFALAARLGGAPLFVRAVLSRPMLLRMLFEVTGRLFYTLAIALTPLSMTSIILQATPIAVVGGAALLLGEQVGWRRWTAILVGLAGVMIIIQPGTGSFSPLSMLAVIGMLGFAGRDLASRVAPASLGTALLGFYGFLAVFVAGAIYALWSGESLVVPDKSAALCLLGAILVGAGAYAGLMKAMRTGEVSAVTPFRYTRLIFGIALGVLFFGEGLTLAMFLGSGLIVVSGLFILQRSKQASSAT